MCHRPPVTARASSANWTDILHVTNFLYVCRPMYFLYHLFDCLSRTQTGLTVHGLFVLFVIYIFILWFVWRIASTILIDEDCSSFAMYVLTDVSDTSVQSCTTTFCCSWTVPKASCSRWPSTARRYSSCRPPVSRRTRSPSTTTQRRSRSTGQTSSLARFVAPLWTAPTRKYSFSCSQVKMMNSASEASTASNYAYVLLW